ncbi:MAG TPA: hypothetical protein VFG95_01365, partial [Nitrospiria bacterium]|nr:hypothetical protein [Nitrospiria bacterium]
HNGRERLPRARDLTVLTEISWHAAVSADDPFFCLLVPLKEQANGGLKNLEGLIEQFGLKTPRLRDMPGEVSDETQKTDRPCRLYRFRRRRPINGGRFGKWKSGRLSLTGSLLSSRVFLRSFFHFPSKCKHRPIQFGSGWSHFLPIGRNPEADTNLGKGQPIKED